MSFRNNLIATSVLTLVSVCGVSSNANAADTKPIVRETCTQETRIGFWQVGHPGKSSQFPKRAVRKVVQCSTAASKPLILASYTDARGGLALVRGDTERALEQIHGRKLGSNSASVLTNHCVALTVLRQWSQAADACDAAVASALDERASAARRWGVPRNLIDRGVAVAYSNRAVMHWLSSDAVAAHNDLAKARNLAPNASYVMRNLDVTEGAPSLARAPEGHAPIG